MCVELPTGAKGILPLIGSCDGGRDRWYNHIAAEPEIGCSCDHSIRRFFGKGEVDRLTGVTLSRDAHVVGSIGHKPQRFYPPCPLSDSQNKSDLLSLSPLILGGNGWLTVPIYRRGNVILAVVLRIVFDAGDDTEICRQQACVRSGYLMDGL